MRKKCSAGRTEFIVFWLIAVIACLFFWKGVYSCFAADDGWLPKINWSLVYVDSEQPGTGDGFSELAINAFDGDINTHWFTQWSSDQTIHPHEIQIDLGAVHTLDAFSYLPPQRTNVNGRVGKYEFYVTENITAGWGEPVVSGEFQDGLEDKIAVFNYPKAGRFVRFVALSEVNGHNSYTAVAEIGVRVSKSVVEIPEGDIKITFDPSPDPRATGHSLYWTSMVTDEGIKTDLKKETIYTIPKGTFVVGHTYRLTAAAYGLVDGKEAESVHSEPLFVRLIQEPPITEDPDDPELIKPSPPRLLEVRWKQK